MRRHDKPYKPPVPTNCDECGKDIKRNEKKLCHDCQIELDGMRIVFYGKGNDVTIQGTLHYNRAHPGPSVPYWWKKRSLKPPKIYWCEECAHWCSLDCCDHYDNEGRRIRS